MPFFEPPSVEDRQFVSLEASRVANDLFRYIRPMHVGRTVLKHGESDYETVSYPTQDQCDAAELVYLGGHRYEITEEEATALEEAGYEVEE